MKERDFTVGIVSTVFPFQAYNRYCYNKVDEELMIIDKMFGYTTRFKVKGALMWIAM